MGSLRDLALAWSALPSQTPELSEELLPLPFLVPVSVDGFGVEGKPTLLVTQRALGRDTPTYSPHLATDQHLRQRAKFARSDVPVRALVSTWIVGRHEQQPAPGKGTILRHRTAG